MTTAVNYNAMKLLETPALGDAVRLATMGLNDRPGHIGVVQDGRMNNGHLVMLTIHVPNNLVPKYRDGYPRAC